MYFVDRYCCRAEADRPFFGMAESADENMPDLTVEQLRHQLLRILVPH